MGQVDEVHHPEDERQTRREDEQERADGEPVQRLKDELLRRHGRARLSPLLLPGVGDSADLVDDLVHVLAALLRDLADVDVVDDVVRVLVELEGAAR